MFESQLRIALLLWMLSSTVMRAQLKTTLIDGDFVPEKTSLHIESANTKYKDPPQVYFDSTSKIWHATWTQFDKYKSKSKNDVSIIYYARSIEGRSWTSPRQLNTLAGDCRDGDSTLKGPVPCTGARGELYVVWASPKGLAFQRSLDTGRTWLKEEKFLTPLKGGWSYMVNGVRSNGLPSLVCDLSGGAHHGRLYVCWSDEKNGIKDKDVFVMYSDDQGETWTDPIIVTYRPNHKEQFRPSMCVDAKSGYLYILYFDKQNYLEGNETDLYMALSKDGATKFDNYKINDKSFAFNANYTALVYDSCIKVRWLQPGAQGRFLLHEALVNDSLLYNAYLSTILQDMEVERSFRYADTIRVKFNMKQNTMLSATISKPLEPAFEKIVFKNKRVFEGESSVLIDMKALGLKKGNYTLNFYYQGKNTYVWIVDE